MKIAFRLAEALDLYEEPVTTASRLMTAEQ